MATQPDVTHVTTDCEPRGLSNSTPWPPAASCRLIRLAVVSRLYSYTELFRRLRYLCWFFVLISKNFTAKLSQKFRHSYVSYSVDWIAVPCVHIHYSLNVKKTVVYIHMSTASKTSKTAKLAWWRRLSAIRVFVLHRWPWNCSALLPVGCATVLPILVFLVGRFGTYE